MNVTCVALEPDGRMRLEAEPAAVAAWRAGRGPYWIHLAGGEPEEIDTWLASLGADPELRRLMQVVGKEQTSLLPLVDAVFVAYPLPAGGPTRRPPRFGYLCLDRLVVTMYEELEPETVLEKAPITRLKLREGTTAGVLCSLAMVHSTRLRAQVVALRAEGDALADRMDANPWAVSMDEVLALKRRVLMLGVALDEQLAVFQVLRASRLAVLPLSSLEDSFQMVIEVARATDRDIDRLDRRLSDLRGLHQSAEQDRMNRRLGLLTVISAIFMPLTLIAGIYGMNFDVMPELHYRYSYPVALGVMALIAAGLAWYLRTWWWRR